ncbi:MAG: hypothetical protein HY392_03765 [Candidatus Diapherotrites archaeon]|nr:hypothetical protein [Candidatus Diapherotrites archaeon]
MKPPQKKTVKMSSETPWSEDKLLEALSPGRKTDLEVEKRLSKLGAEYIVLFVVDSQKIQETKTSILRLFMKNSLRGTLVSIGMPGKKILSQLKEANTPTEYLSIIDASPAKENGKTDTQITVLEEQEDLSILFSEVEKKISEKKSNGFLVFDSINALLVYNEEKGVEKFFHTIVSKLSGLGIKTVILAIDSKKGENTVKTIGNFCDSVEKL